MGRTKVKHGANVCVCAVRGFIRSRVSTVGMKVICRDVLAG